MARIPWKALIGIAGLGLTTAAGMGLYHYRPLTIDVLQPESNVAIRVFGLGTVEARLLSKLSFKVAGTLTDLRADHGDHVSAGQLLAGIESSEQKARVAKASAQILSAEASVQVAEAAARKSAALVAQRAQINQRRQALLARQAVSVEAAEEAQLNEAVARADALVTQSEIETAKAKLDDAKAQYEFESVILSQHELRAPFDGVIVTRAKELGTVVNSIDALFTLVAPETVWMLAYVDEARSGDIQVGQPVEIKLRSLPQHAFRGRVTRIGIESDRLNEERRIYINCDNCPEAFYLGEQAEVLITTAILPQAVMLPEFAIDLFDGSSGTIWTIENGRLLCRRATFGKRSLDGRIELTGGVGEGVAVPAAVSTDFREERSVRVTLGQGR